MQTEPSSQLTGVIIGAAVLALGSLLTFLGSLLNSWLTGRREEKQWTRQQDADRDKRKHEEKTKERDRRREMFQNALTQLSSLMSIENDSSSPTEEQLRRIEEAQKWLNLLSVSYRADDSPIAFHSTLEDFTNHPFNYMQDMRDAVVKLSKSDDLLFPGVSKETKLISAGSEPRGIEFRMEIDDDFRKEQLKKGIELPQSYSFFSQLTELTESQRELLVNIFYPNYKTVPQSLHLPVPSATPNPQQPYTRGHQWRGRVNPETVRPEQILEMWEKDYNEAFSKVNEVKP